jgi:hypothetical protein
MPKAIVIETAQVEDAAKWKRQFQTHTDLFRELTATKVNYTATADNEVALVIAVDDVDKFLKVLASPTTAAAMANDGVKRETVKTFVLTDELEL